MAWLVIGALAGVVLFLHGFRMLRYKWLILNTPSSKIRSASMGLVEVSGAAIGPRTIPAGITGVACYYYRAAAYQLKQSGRNRSWQCVAGESLSVPFFVEDPTGRMLVDPEGASLDIERNFKDEFDTSLLSSNRDMLPENVAHFLNRNNVTFSANTRVEEYCIKPDSPLFVFGALCPNSTAAEWTPAVHAAATSPLHLQFNFFGRGANSIFRSTVDPSYVASLCPEVRRTCPDEGLPAVAGRARASAVWSSISMDDENAASARTAPQTSAVATADPDDSAPGELPAAADAPPAAAQTDAHDYAGFDLCPPAVIRKGPLGEPARRGGPFMISAHSQRDVVRSLAWKSALCIWGGPALTLACLYLLAAIFGWT